MRQFFISISLLFFLVPQLSIAQAVRYDTPSKLPVPRFVSMRFNVVNGRAGPDEDYPIRFVYKQVGLPVKVIAETVDWRKIEDPDGTQVWVHKRNLDSKRTLIIRPSQKGATHVMLYNKNTQNNKVIAKIASGSICEILDAQEGWRKIKIGNYTGWIIAIDAWAS